MDGRKVEKFLYLPPFSLRRIAAFAAVCVLPFLIAPLGALQPQSITTPVIANERVTIHGTIHPLALAKYDQGAVSDSQTTGTLLLILGRSAAAQNDLDAFAKSASTPGSPEYRQWLTPERFGERFGANPQDIATVTTWLLANGFKVEKVSPAGNLIRFSGTAGAIRTAFQTEIHRYQIGGETHLANISEISIPAALTSVVRGVASLNDFRPKSNVIRAPHASATKKSANAFITPEYTYYGPTTWGTNNWDVFYYPGAGDTATIYDTPNTAMNSAYTGTTWTGAGVTIGIAGDSTLGTYGVADVTRYRSVFLNETWGQASTDAQLPVTVIDGNSPGLTSDGLEALVDIEQAESVAPKALVTLYISSNTDLQSGLFLAIERAINDNAISILNISFGACESSFGPSGNALINELYEQAVAQGISITVSAGDSGSAGCDGGSLGFGVGASSGLAVNGLASTPWNVAVGGTDFNVLNTSTLATVKQYINVGASVNTGAAKAPYWGSALAYIPEEPWNDSTSVFTTYANNVPYKWGNGPENTMAGGGGVSSAAVCSGTITAADSCTGTLKGYSKPAYQTALTPSDGVRDVPDVSFFSGAFMSDDGYSYNFNSSWAICSDDWINEAINPNATDYDCQTIVGTAGCGGTCTLDAGTTGVTPVGGTSTAAPLMAGVLALVSQSQGGARLGQPNYVLYGLAASKPSVFHDITQGNNSVLCTSGTTNCGSNGFINGYIAGTGYDLATGIGSIDIAKLVSNWSTVSFGTTTTTLKAGTSATTLGTGALTVAHGTPLYFQVSVTPSTATGYVVLTTNNSQENSDSILTAPITNGVATFNTLSLPGGSYTLYARYGGDSANSASVSAGIPVVVSPETSSVKLLINSYSPINGYIAAGNTLIANNTNTAPYGVVLYADLIPYGTTEGYGKGNPATGTVTLSMNGTQLASLPLGSEGSAFYQFNTTPMTPGTYTFAVSYSGDSSYKASSITQSLTITKAPVALDSSSGVAGCKTGGYLGATTTDFICSVGMLLVTSSDGTPPTGMVTIAVNGVVYDTVAVTGSLYVVSGDYSSPDTASGGDYVDLTTLLGVGGTAYFTLTYSGDGNYLSYGPITSSTFTVPQPANAAITLTNSGTVYISSPGQSGTGTITITPSNGFIGTVALSCSLTSAAGTTNAPTCSIPSVSITGTAAQTSTLTITTTAASKGAVRKVASGYTGYGTALAVFCLVLLMRPRQRRGWITPLAVLMMGFALFTASGCSSGSPSSGNPGTATGTYTFTVTGVNGTVTGSTVVTVNVQ